MGGDTEPEPGWQITRETAVLLSVDGGGRGRLWAEASVEAGVV